MKVENISDNRNLSDDCIISDNRDISDNRGVVCANSWITVSFGAPKCAPNLRKSNKI